MRRLANIALWAGAGSAILAPAVAGILVGVFGCDVIILSPAFDESVVEVNRLEWSRGQPVASLYGVPSNKLIRVIFADRSKIIVPSEDPSQTLLRVDKEKGENPLQARTLWFFATWAAVAGLVAAASGGGLLLWKGRA